MVERICEKAFMQVQKEVKEVDLYTGGLIHGRGYFSNS